MILEIFRSTIQFSDQKIVSPAQDCRAERKLREELSQRKNYFWAEN